MPLKLGPDMLNRDDPTTPLTTQLADALRHALLTKDLDPGDALPGENVIADAVHLSRPMVRNALDVLLGEGLIVRRKGAATRVAIPPSVRVVTLTGGSGRLGADDPEESFPADHGATWDDYTVAPVTITRETATGQDAEFLKVRKGTPILRRWLVENLGGKPVQLQRQAMRYRAVKGTLIETEVLKHAGILTELRSIGIHPTHCIEIFAPRMPNKVERELLDLPSGPVWDWLRSLVIADDPDAGDLTAVDFTPVQVSRIIVPCSRMHLRTEGRLSLPAAAG